MKKHSKHTQSLPRTDDATANNQSLKTLNESVDETKELLKHINTQKPVQREQVKLRKF